MTLLIEDAAIMQKSSPTLRPRSLKHICPTTCAVCGRKANGYHYEAPSCTGCKTFFRRIVVSQAALSCTRDGNCVTDCDVGNFCRSCRFDKCIFVGMNPQGIRIADVDQNTVIKGIFDRRDSNRSSSQTPETVTLAAEAGKLIDRLELFEDHITKERVKEYSFASIKDFLRRNGTPSSPHGQTEYISEEFWSLVAPFQTQKELTLSDILSGLVYATLFSFFERLEEEDKTVLLKNGALLIFNFVQAYEYYRSRREENEEDMEVDSPISPLAEKLRSQVIEPICRLEISHKEFVLLKALLLCNASFPDLSDEGWTLIQEEKDKLSSALFNHCLFTHESNGPARFGACLAVVNSLQATTKLQKDVLLLSRNELTGGGGILEEVINH